MDPFAYKQFTHEEAITGKKRRYIMVPKASFYIMYILLFAVGITCIWLVFP